MKNFAVIALMKNTQDIIAVRYTKKMERKNIVNILIKDVSLVTKRDHNTAGTMLAFI